MVDFLATGMAPFTVALLIVAAVGLIEALSLLVGFSLSGAVDHLLPDLHAPDASGADLGPLSAVTSWLSVGRIPFLIWLIILLTSFALGGFALQTVWLQALGWLLPAPVAVVLAALAALFATGAIGRWLARIFPPDATDVASHSELIGATAQIIRGEARLGLPAEAKTTDLRGRTHYLLVEPDEPDLVLGAGERALIVRQHGAVFRVVTRLQN